MAEIKTKKTPDLRAILEFSDSESLVLPDFVVGILYRFLGSIIHGSGFSKLSISTERTRKDRVAIYVESGSSHRYILSIDEVEAIGRFLMRSQTEKMFVPFDSGATDILSRALRSSNPSTPTKNVSDGGFDKESSDAEINQLDNCIETTQKQTEKIRIETRNTLSDLAEVVATL